MTLPDVIHRTELPIDDRPHGIDLTGDLLHAAVRRHGTVDVWFKARRDPAMQHMRRSFQIVATGQPIPAWLDRHHRTAISPDGALVWHVLENWCPHESVRIQAVGERARAGVCQVCGIPVSQTGGSGWAPIE